MKFIPLILLAVIVVALGGAAKADSARITHDFVTKASVGNQFEILSSQIALNKTQNPAIRQFAQQMITDHTKAGDQLKATLASENKSAMASSALDEKHQTLLEDLKVTAPGPTFDKKYINDQVNAHDDTVSLFKKYVKKGDDVPLRQFAGDTLPTLEQHQQMAHALK